MALHLVDARPSSIDGVHVVTARSARGFARHTHDQYGIGLVEAGAQTSASGRGPVVAAAGDLISVNPGEVHDGHPVDDRGRVWRMVYFDPPVLKHLTGSSRDFAHPALRAPGLAATFRRLFHAVGDPTLRLAAEEALTMVRLSLDDRARPLPRPASVARAVQVLQDDPARSMSLAELAAMAGLSRFHFLRSFARATGLSPHAFQVQSRLHLARRLILQGHPLAAAATEAGFADQSHLTRLFTRSYGMTPGTYRRNFVQDRRCSLRH